MSSYAFFFTEIYPDIRGSYLNPEGKVDSRAVAKAAGAKWNALSEDEKKVSGVGGRMSTSKREKGYEAMAKAVCKSNIITHPEC
jgi:hypothetical protein